MILGIDFQGLQIVLLQSKLFADKAPCNFYEVNILIELKFEYFFPYKNFE